MPAITDAQNLVDEYIKEPSLKNHCKIVSKIMRAFAEEYDEDTDKWEICGLIHDFDYEKYPDEHPMKGKSILEEKGYPDDIIEAIQGHGSRAGVPRVTKMAKTLNAVDELSGLMWAISLMRPNGFADMEVKSVKKKFKDKSFAAKVNREEILQGVEEMGLTLDEMIEKLIKIFKEMK